MSTTNPTVEITMTDEARVAFQTLGKLCEHLTTIRSLVHNMVWPVMDEAESAAWKEITGYLDAVGGPPRDATAIANGIEAAVQSVIENEKRPGGLLHP